jgi:hypothetical protein
VRLLVEILEVGLLMIGVKVQQLHILVVEGVEENILLCVERHLHLGILEAMDDIGLR